MKIIVYAGSLRPGGGITVASNIIKAMATRKNVQIDVYTGARDSSTALQPLFKSLPQVRERQFYPNLGSEIRYLISKFYFIPLTLFNRKILLLSINYWVPCFCKQIVYHINLLNFKKVPNDNFSKKIKEFDAALACKLASINWFESKYLMHEAETYLGHAIRNPHLLYACVDDDFVKTKTKQSNNTNIMAVSSVQPHKDNEVCISVLGKLAHDHPEVNWTLTIVGGQSKRQWEKFKSLANSKSLGNKISFTGPIKKSQLSLMLNQSMCLMNTSRIESFCMVAIEAMASRCPAIVTDETSMPESVGEAAIVVKAGSVEEFAAAVYSLYTDARLRSKYIEKGIIRANQFSTSAFNTKLLELIPEI